MTEKKPVIEVKDLWYTYPNGVVAIKGIDLKIMQGETVGVIGQNGSGKTTLVKHFNGLLKPTKGQVIVQGIDTKDASTPELSKTVGYVFQNPSHQLFSRTIDEELAFGPTNLKLPPEDVEARVEEAIEFFGLQNNRSQHPLSLSFPLKKKVSIASIYAMKPNIFILDEPTTAQDSIGIRMIGEMVEKVKKEKATIVVVSHDMRFVAEHVERAIMLWDGEVINDGATKEIFSNFEALKKTHVHPPQITQLSQRLSPVRPDLPETALTIEELVAPLAKAL